MERYNRYGFPGRSGVGVGIFGIGSLFGGLIFGIGSFVFGAIFGMGSCVGRGGTTSGAPDFPRFGGLGFGFFFKGVRGAG